MARFHDWIELAGSTIRSLDGREVTGLYSFEWPEAKRALIEEYERDIEKEGRQVVRHIRVVSALFYGLTKRLTPVRRLLLAVSAFLLAGGLASIILDQVKISNLAAIVCSSLLGVTLLGLELIDKLKYRDELELARDLPQARAAARQAMGGGP